MTTSLCDCRTDGFCPRYWRDMSGRFREICSGTNVDLGTAAAFREQWALEAKIVGPPPTKYHRPLPIHLKVSHAPGDAVAMTAALYSLHEGNPGRYSTSVECPYSEVFEGSPHVTPRVVGAQEVHMHYPAVKDSCDRGIHFMQAWCEFLGTALGIHVPLLTDRPRLYFPDAAPPPAEDFWLVCAGVKDDFTAKRWGGYQEAVSLLKGRVRFVQVGRGDHDHPRLSGVEDMVGRTTLRGLFALARRARGVLCGVSLLMHVAAALEKPAIVLAGGREPVAWNAYPRQHYLHTVGALPCPSWRGRVGEACWRSRADGPAGKNTCVRSSGGVPACMEMIRPAWVAELVERYNS